jgi:hypothetical protein
LSNVDARIRIVKCSSVNAFSGYHSIPELLHRVALKDARKKGLDAVNDGEPEADPTRSPNRFIDRNTQVLKQDRDLC